MIFIVSTEVFSDIESAKWNRESITWSIPQEIDSPIIEKAEVSPEPESPTDEGILHEDGNTKLAFLIRIPGKDIRRKLLEGVSYNGGGWVLMFLKRNQPYLWNLMTMAMKSTNQWKIRLRTAVELDNRLDLLLEKGFKSDVTKLRFRVRQLTGFDEVEARIQRVNLGRIPYSASIRDTTLPLSDMLLSPQFQTLSTYLQLEVH